MAQSHVGGGSNQAAAYIRSCKAPTLYNPLKAEGKTAMCKPEKAMLA